MDGILYIGCKFIKALEMDKATFSRTIRDLNMGDEDDQHGYQVIYPDGYISWSPRSTFEDAYREISQVEIDFIANNI